MRKKDYLMIAGAVRQMYSLGDNHLYVADMLAVTLAKNDPKFDRQKFLTACGIQTEVTLCQYCDDRATTLSRIGTPFTAVCEKHIYGKD
jgi:hypothetical protein